MDDQKKNPEYGEPADQRPLYGEGGDEKAGISDPDAAVEEGKDHAKKAGEQAEKSSGGGGQEGV